MPIDESSRHGPGSAGTRKCDRSGTISHTEHWRPERTGSTDGRRTAQHHSRRCTRTADCSGAGRHTWRNAIGGTVGGTKLARITGIAGVSNVPWVANFAHVSWVASFPHVPHIPQVSSIPAVSHLTRVPSIPRVPRVSHIPDVSRITRRFPDIPRIARITRVPDVPRIAHVSWIPGVSRVSVGTGVRVRRMRHVRTVGGVLCVRSMRHGWVGRMSGMRRKVMRHVHSAVRD